MTTTTTSTTSLQPLYTGQPALTGTLIKNGEDFVRALSSHSTRLAFYAVTPGWDGLPTASVKHA